MRCRFVSGVHISANCSAIDRAHSSNDSHDATLIIRRSPITVPTRALTQPEATRATVKPGQAEFRFV